jgi:N-acetylmuramoyl-L-alanine amidase
MAEIAQLKREILREVVRDNLDLVEGRRREPLRPAQRRRRTLVFAIGFVVAPLALFLSLNALTTGKGERTDVLVVGSPAAPASASAAALLPAPKGMEPSLFRLDVKTIVLDAGHGGHDPGARAAGGLSEKEITLDIARRVRTLLAAGKLAVEMTREGDAGLSLRERALFANTRKGDLFVSIHVNSMPMADAVGVETFFLGAAADARVERLAGDENRDSGYALHDFKRLLEGVYTGVRQGESRTLAAAVQESLVAALRKRNPGLENRGVKSAPFAVLVGTDMPGILAEVSCLSAPDEARRLGDPAYRQAIARALADGVLAYAEARNHPAGGRS